MISRVVGFGWLVFQDSKILVQISKSHVLFDAMLLELSTVRKCFARFRSGNSDLKKQEHFGRPTVVNDDQIEVLI